MRLICGINGAALVGVLNVLRLNHSPGSECEDHCLYRAFPDHRRRVMRRVWRGL